MHRDPAITVEARFLETRGRTRSLTSFNGDEYHALDTLKAATGGLGRFGASLIRTPSAILAAGNEMREAMTTGDTGKLRLNRIPNSVDTLAPTNRFVEAINTVPITAGIPYHSIMGDRGRGGNKDHTPPISTDGVVPYWSSHLDGARSELIVPSNHSAHQNPQAIAEVDRILRSNAGVPANHPATK